MQNVTALHITRVLRAELRTAIARHAEAAYPNECCGALLVRDSRVVGTLPLHNDSPEPRRRYSVGPADYRAAEAEALHMDAEIGGFYHSHADAPPDPSSTDLALAWPGMLYVIAGVQRGVVSGWRAWSIETQSVGGGSIHVHPGENRHSGPAAAVYRPAP